MSRMILHPDYKYPHIKNDIAVVELAQDAVWSDTVGPVCLPNPNSKVIPAGDQATIAGWG